MVGAMAVLLWPVVLDIFSVLGIDGRLANLGVAAAGIAAGDNGNVLDPNIRGAGALRFPPTQLQYYIYAWSNPASEVTIPLFNYWDCQSFYAQMFIGSYILHQKGYSPVTFHLGIF